MSEMDFQRSRNLPQRSKQKTSPQGLDERALGDIAAGPARAIEQIEIAMADFDSDVLPPVPDQREIVISLMANANVLLKAGETRLAINIFRNVLMRVPEHPEALMKMGRSLRDTERHDQALKCFRALARTAPSSEVRLQAQILVAETLYLMERDEMALAVYREVLKNVISDQDQLFEIYKNVGNIHVRARDFEAGEEFYNKAYTIRPDSDVLMVNYGTLEIQTENLGEAVARFRRAVEINPRNDRAWVGLAMIHRTMGDCELAQANVERALDINNGNRTALRLIADWGFNDQCYSSAIARLQDYVSGKGSEDVEFCFVLAKVFTQVGRLTEARLEMERVLALDPCIEGGENLTRALDAEIAKRQGAAQVGADT